MELSADLDSYLRGARDAERLEIPLKRWFGVAVHRYPAELTNPRAPAMICPQPLCRLAPVTTGMTSGSPRILLCSNQAAGLLRYMEGWSRQRLNRQLVIESLQQPDLLAELASDSFDLAVVQAVPAEALDGLVHDLVRVARQGLITRPHSGLQR
jgi:hypothetical protein